MAGAHHSHIYSCPSLLCELWARDTVSRQSLRSFWGGQEGLSRIWQHWMEKASGYVSDKRISYFLEVPWSPGHDVYTCSRKGETKWGLRAHWNPQLCNSECHWALESFMSHKWPMLSKCLLANFLLRRKCWEILHKGKIFPMLLVLIFLNFFT